MTFYEVTEEDRELIRLAVEVMEKNFDRGTYYHVVGCALKCGSGKIYTGVNCDGIHGSCAEFVTIGTAYSAGERQFDTIVASHKNTPHGVLPPCGNCRQMMVEYCPDIKVLLNNDEGELIKVSARDLLPYCWLPLPDE